MSKYDCVYLKYTTWDFPGSLVVETHASHRKRHRFDLWLGSSSCCVVWPNKTTGNCESLCVVQQKHISCTSTIPQQKI